ncbi:hypothetical protein Pryu01_02654 [Paraliobacillus ryukyuensis]|uniref:CAAX prenyl protease-like protein n=1 Tax=Paraliobacillus ryukyuensis TaxID=200904 RepID=A0A366E1F0_9BACI|nr:type II CAAX endopeptidase family protein [Paraliobacillus ryukyuensis]RBO95324.1 CAAX prenyl protease-like protein [Paraliobacillus ryukyuensis]
MRHVKNNALFIISLVFIGCLIMAWVDAIWVPNYAIKSGIKLGLFLILPLVYARMDKNTSFTRLFSYRKDSLLFSILIGVGVYIFIVGAYFIFGSFFDLTSITTSLEASVGVSATNFLFVAIYISFINSLVEEFFFRGFAFLSLKKVTNRPFAYLFSAGLFAIYHVFMVINWFNFGLFLLLLISLFIAGILFNWLNERNENIYTSWFVHMAGNFAINTIGLILFDII